MPVDPRGEDLKRYLEQDPGGPVVMLNLLKYRAGGEESYRAYSEALKDYLPTIGAEVLYVGNCSTALVAPASWDWDAVLIVRLSQSPGVQRDGQRLGVSGGEPPAHGGVDRGGPPGDGAVDRGTVIDQQHRLAQVSQCASSGTRILAAKAQLQPALQQATLIHR